jgi:hypothetical protein
VQAYRPRGRCERQLNLPAWKHGRTPARYRMSPL